MNIQRVAVIGSGGGGKTTLALEIGRALDLPVYHLDRLFWRSGWVETPPEEWETIHRDLCANPRWVIDGNYGGTMDQRLQACDAVVYLDRPTMVCLWNVVKRFLLFRGKTRPDMTPGCQEQLDWDFIRWILAYRRRNRPRILKKLADLDSGKRVAILRSRRDMDGFLRTLRRERFRAGSDTQGMQD
jgi:adenylate kinase family enzyme